MLHTKSWPGILKWLSAQLVKQKRTDFKPRNDDISQMGMNTDACNLCCLSLGRAYDTAKENLSGANQEVFLMEIGVGFQGSVKLPFYNDSLISSLGYCWNI
jgi:exocyst complex component 5